MHDLHVSTAMVQTPMLWFYGPEVLCVFKWQNKKCHLCKVSSISQCDIIVFHPHFYNSTNKKISLHSGSGTLVIYSNYILSALRKESLLSTILEQVILVHLNMTMKFKFPKLLLEHLRSISAKPTGLSTFINSLLGNGN